MVEKFREIRRSGRGMVDRSHMASLADHGRNFDFYSK